MPTVRGRRRTCGPRRTRRRRRPDGARTGRSPTPPRPPRPWRGARPMPGPEGRNALLHRTAVGVEPAVSGQHEIADRRVAVALEHGQLRRGGRDFRVLRPPVGIEFRGPAGRRPGQLRGSPDKSMARRVSAAPPGPLAVRRDVTVDEQLEVVRGASRAVTSRAWVHAGVVPDNDRWGPSTPRAACDRPAPGAGYFGGLFLRNRSLRSANGAWVAICSPMDELLPACAASVCRWCSLSWQ